MMKSDNDSAVSGQSPIDRRARNRDVPTSTTSLESGLASSREGLSPGRSKAGTNSADKHRSLENPGFIRGEQLWPSSFRATSSVKNNLGTLAEHLGNDKFTEQLDRKTDEKSGKTSSIFSLSRQRSCKESNRRFENEKNSSKENHRPIVGGSMRYTGNFYFADKSSSSVKPNSNDSGIVPGRLSVDENLLSRKSLYSPRNSDSFTNTLDSESEYSDACSSANFSSPAIGRSSPSSRKLGIEVPSRYTKDNSTRTRRGTSDSNSEDSSMLKKFTLKNAIKKANSLTGYRSSKSQWALSPGRSKSPTMSVETKEKVSSFLSLKPPTSPSKVKSVEKFLHMGFDFFKSKKSSLDVSPMGFGNSEVVHQLRLLDNRLVQWRYANARAEVVDRNISNQAQINLLYAWDSIVKLRRPVLQKKIQYQKEKLEMKLNFILYSQIKLLETWGDMERQHLSAIAVTKESLHSAVCRVPLIEGAKVDKKSASIVLRHASDLTASIKLMINNLSSSADKTAVSLSELAKVVAQEKLLLEEFYDVYRTISVFELREKSLKCGLVQLNYWQQQYLQQI